MAGARIAVIDDDQANVDFLQAFLEDEGYEVVTHTDVREAYAFVKEHRPAVLILDLLQGRHPVGLQVVDLLKWDPETQNLPILVVSADTPTLRGHTDQLRSFGVVSLDKPYLLDDLLSLIRSVLFN